MESFDILFPLNISPLTYNVPEDLKGLVKPGQFVKAYIKNTERVGLVIKRSLEHGVKPINGLCGSEPIISEPLLKLIEWMSDYYVVNKGLVFKTMYSKEFFEVVFNLSAKGDGTSANLPIRQNNGKYQTILFHAPTFEEEINLLSDILRKEKNIIILAPERSYVERISEKLGSILGERLSLLHGDLSKNEKRQVFLRIISGQSDVVIGTRIAIFSPIKCVSRIVVLREEDDSYKNLQGMRFHGRDMAVMRGYLEKAEVILSSSAPSAESYYNAMRGKYKFVRYRGKIKTPKVEIIDINRSRKVSAYLSKRAIEVAETCLQSGGRILFLINRKGYSLIRCRDCGYVEGCNICKIPLVYHKDKNQLICHYCNKIFPVKDLCPSCGGATLDAVGAGIQRIEAEIKKYLGIKPLRLEKGMKIVNSGLNQGSGIKDSIIVSTGIIKQLFPERSFKACIFINPDIHLQFPDFRSGEHLFQELHNIRECVEVDGFLMIQTRFPENHVYRSFRKGVLDDFYNVELSLRKSLLYPPFSRFAIVRITSMREDMKIIDTSLNRTVGDLIYGSQCLESEVKGKTSWRLILKSSSKRGLRNGIRELIYSIGDKKGVNIIVDVDPITIG